ncbi:hypothetical protein PJWF_00051 [Achromobacter phage JWF]|uniref:hypothetical protein n=1 Tax=Achromobacter phage JWF TaxID=1589748 RepID=UPI000588E239|nr:hypothetical protein AXJ13_gp051 [Achromobacter phage JWF]AJD82945.1 hypothetical protein PJWF_00051 [Achromobacter phage JWF]
MGMRTNEEIGGELNRLAECRKFIPNMLKHCLDAQVEVLEGRMTHNEIFDKWGEESTGEDFDQQLLDAVVEAETWMIEQCDEAPNVNWQEFKNN